MSLNGGVDRNFKDEVPEVRPHRERCPHGIESLFLGCWVSTPCQPCKPSVSCFDYTRLLQAYPSSQSLSSQHLYQHLGHCIWWMCFLRRRHVMGTGPQAKNMKRFSELRRRSADSRSLIFEAGRGPYILRRDGGYCRKSDGVDINAGWSWT